MRAASEARLFQPSTDCPGSMPSSRASQVSADLGSPMKRAVHAEARQSVGDAMTAEAPSAASQRRTVPDSP